MKGIRIAALLLVTVLLAGALAGCARTDRGLELGSGFTPYDEAAFREEIARDGEGRVLLAENGTTPFGSVIYTPVPAASAADEESEPDKLERAAEFLADALSKMTGAAFSAAVAVSWCSVVMSFSFSVRGSVSGLRGRPRGIGCARFASRLRRA